VPAAALAAVAALEVIGLGEHEPAVVADVVVHALFQGVERRWRWSIVSFVLAQQGNGSGLNCGVNFLTPF
jgi:hypothetical protein